MKKKNTFIPSCLALLIASLSLASCGNNDKHEAKTEWKWDSSSHWHECKTEGHTDKLDVASHIFSEGKVTTPATEEAEGVMTFTCNVCSFEKTEVIAKLEHTHKFDATKWSSDENGHWHPATCSHTNEKDSYAAHTFNDGVITLEPSETSTGIKTYTCTVCSYEKSETLPKKEHVHTYSDEWVSNNEYHWHAATCGHTNERKDYEKHTLSDWQEVVQADYGVNKVLKATCSVCHKNILKEVEGSALQAKERDINFYDDYYNHGKAFDGLPFDPFESIYMLTPNIDKSLFELMFKNTKTNEITNTPPSNAGTYDYTFKIPASNEWKEWIVEGNFTIKPYTLKWSDAITENGGKDFEKEFSSPAKNEIYTFSEINIGDYYEEEVIVYVPSSLTNAGRNVINVSDLYLKNSNYQLDIKTGITSNAFTYTLWDDTDNGAFVGTSQCGALMCPGTIKHGTISLNDEMLAVNSLQLVNVSKIGLLNAEGNEIGEQEKATAGDNVNLWYTSRNKNITTINVPRNSYLVSPKGMTHDEIGSGNLTYQAGETRVFKENFMYIQQTYISYTLSNTENASFKVYSWSSMKGELVEMSPEDAGYYSFTSKVKYEVYIVVTAKDSTTTRLTSKNLG